MIPDRAPVDELLRSTIESETGFDCGLVRAPDGHDGPDPPVPYSILVPLPTSIYVGDQADPHRGCRWAWDVVGVGKRADQAQMLLDLAARVLVGREPPEDDYGTDLPGLEGRELYTGAPEIDSTDQRLIHRSIEFQATVSGT